VARCTAPAKRPGDWGVTVKSWREYCAERGKIPLITGKKEPMLSQITYCDVCHQRHETSPAVPHPRYSELKHYTGMTQQVCQECTRYLFKKRGGKYDDHSADDGCGSAV
jgi:hypothetical protein